MSVCGSVCSRVTELDERKSDGVIERAIEHMCALYLYGKCMCTCVFFHKPLCVCVYVCACMCENVSEFVKLSKCVCVCV